MTSKLRTWANENQPEIYRQGYWNQISFVRDTLAGIFAENFEEYEDFFDVSGTHMSKSVLLPVYKCETKQGLVMQFRYNFHDWNLSVSSPRPLECGDFVGVLSPNQLTGIDYCFFQGMDMQFGPYSNNKQNFSLYCYNNYELYTIFMVIKKALSDS